MAEMSINDFGKMWTAKKHTSSDKDLSISLADIGGGKKGVHLVIRNDKDKLFQSGKVSVMTFIDYLLIKDDEEGYKLARVSSNTFSVVIRDESLVKWAKKRTGHYDLSQSFEHGCCYIHAKPIE